MAIANKVFSPTSYEYGEYTRNNITKKIVTTLYWNIAYTDDSSPAVTVNVTGSTSFEPYHLITGTANPRTGLVNDSVVEWENLNDTILASWIENEYNNDSALSSFCDYKANYLLTGADPDRKFEPGPFTRE